MYENLAPNEIVEIRTIYYGDKSLVRVAESADGHRYGSNITLFEMFMQKLDEEGYDTTKIRKSISDKS